MTMSRSSRIISLFTKQASESESRRIEPNGAPEGSWAVMTGWDVGTPSAWRMEKPVVADRSLVGSVAGVAESESKRWICKRVSLSTWSCWRPLKGTRGERG